MNPRKLLYIYRIFLNFIFGRRTEGILSQGIEVKKDNKLNAIHHGDVVHPCVRYSETGCLGHKWWMVYTPYYKANPETENPILCYGNSETAEFPSKWYYHSEIKSKPAKGYNSDPNLLIDDTALIIFWRENQTQRCSYNNCSRATFALRISEKGTIEYSNPVLTASEEFCDSEVSASIIKQEDKYIAYATKIRFFFKQVRKLPVPIRRIIDKTLLGIDLLGIYPTHKSYGIAVWESNSLDNTFELKTVNKIKNTNHLYQPWHIDIFENNNTLYAIIQTSQCNADICLARSIDGYTFEFFKQPLITNKSINKIGIYKPCAIVVDGIFHLFYTAQDLDNRDLNKLYHTSMPFNELLGKLK